jgi:hypothetical protein
MRKAEAQALWDQASTLADAAMGRLEDDGVVERVVVPDTDDAIAKDDPRPWQCEQSTGGGSAGAHIHATAAYRRRGARPYNCQWGH